MLAGFLFLPWPESSSGMLRLSWLPGVLYILAALADYADGYLARITNHETRLGEAFDAKMDALGLLIAPLLAISFGQLPIYYAAVGAAYYVFIFGIWLRKKSGRPLVELQPYPEARILAGFQMGFIGVALLPVFSPPVTTIAALIFMTPFLIGFVRDWLVVCGRIHTDSAQWVRRERDIHTWLTKYLPLCLRFSMLWAGWRIFRHGMLPFSPDVAIILNRTLSMTEAMGYAWNSLVFMMIMFGIMGRVAALLIGISTGFTIMRYGSSGTFVLMFSCALAIMLTGTGALSVWQPEDSFLFKRAGERE
jgi:CDP-diacylglycerol--glycerol-3-phosphate 3-phosphatidyltransferase